MNFHNRVAFDFFNKNKDIYFGNLLITGVSGSKLDVLCKCGAVLFLNVARLIKRKQCSSNCPIGLHIQVKDACSKASSVWLKNNMQRVFDDWTIMSYSLISGRNFTVKCVCGNVKDVDMYSIIDGRSGNCGCNRTKRTASTCMVNYGLSNVSQIDSVKQAKINTCLKNFGVEHPAQSPTIQAKTIKTCIRKYGVQYTLMSEEIRTKIQNTCIDRFGSISPFGSLEIQAKIAETCMRIYGFPNPSSSPLIRSKVANTCMERYGVEHPFMLPRAVSSAGATEDTVRGIFESHFNKIFLSIRPQWLKNPETGHLLELDGYNEELKLAFEYDGFQHFRVADFWGGEEELAKIQHRDRIKDRLCEEVGVILIRIPYWEKNNLKQFITAAIALHDF